MVQAVRKKETVKELEGLTGLDFFFLLDFEGLMPSSLLSHLEFSIEP